MSIVLLQTATLYVVSYLSLSRMFISSLVYVQHTKKTPFTQREKELHYFRLNKKTKYICTYLFFLIQSHHDRTEPQS